MIHGIKQKAIKQQQATYRIAGLILELVFPDGLKREEILPSFEPFWIGSITDKKHISIELAFCTPSMQEGNGKLLSDISVVWGERFSFYEKEDCYITTIESEQGDGLWKMKSSKDFSQSVIYLLNEERSVANVLGWLTMVAFGQACLSYRTMLIHASVVTCNGKGYAFLGKSGTGKSTHSRLWLEHINGTQLLNDDNPAIRIENDGQVYVYGTPWSGKTACYKSMKVPIQAFVRLKQSVYNQLSFKKGMAAFVCILPSCTAIRWNKRLFAEMNDTVEAIIQTISVAELECLANEEAARLCYHEILEITNKQMNIH